MIFDNCLFDTARAVFDPANGGGQGAPFTYLQRQRGHYQPMYASHYHKLPGSALESSHIIIVAANLDVAFGDMVQNITRLDGVTPWPGDVDPDVISYTVGYVRVGGAGPLAQRMCYLVRTQFSGPSYSP